VFLSRLQCKPPKSNRWNTDQDVNQEEQNAKLPSLRAKEEKHAKEVNKLRAAKLRMPSLVVAVVPIQRTARVRVRART